MNTPRFFVAMALAPGICLRLPPGAARHVQVLRLQPGLDITLFNGHGGEWSATITQMGRSQVDVAVGAHRAVEREAARAVHLAVGLMAADRMDWLVEKATELGAASLTPLLAARGNLRLSGERMCKKLAHWRAVAAAACEQCGRNRLPDVREPLGLRDFLDQAGQGPARWLLSLDALASGARVQADTLAPNQGVIILSGPEGGLNAEERVATCAAGFVPIGLGPRVLRAETAPLAALVTLLTT